MASKESGDLSPAPLSRRHGNERRLPRDPAGYRAVLEASGSADSKDQEKVAIEEVWLKAPTTPLPDQLVVYDARETVRHALSDHAYELVIHCARCPGHEGANDDALGFLRWDEHSIALIVAGGVGGARSGDRASRVAVEMVIDRLKRRDPSSDPRDNILSAIELANSEILSWGIGAATTLTCVTIQNDEFRCYHVGDSLGLVLGQRGKKKFQTTSHSPVGYLIESGTLEERQAIRHEDLHIVSNLLGSESMSIELTSPVSLSARDTIVLASDGLSDNLYLEEITDKTRKGGLSEAADRLVQLANSRMTSEGTSRPSKPDDLTFILCRRRRT